MEYDKHIRMIFRNKGTGLTGGRRKKYIHIYYVFFFLLLEMLFSRLRALCYIYYGLYIFVVALLLALRCVQCTKMTHVE